MGNLKKDCRIPDEVWSLLESKLGESLSKVDRDFVEDKDRLAATYWSVAGKKREPTDVISNPQVADAIDDTVEDLRLIRKHYLGGRQKRKPGRNRLRFLDEILRLQTIRHRHNSLVNIGPKSFMLSRDEHFPLHLEYVRLEFPTCITRQQAGLLAMDAWSELKQQGLVDDLKDISERTMTLLVFVCTQKPDKPWDSLLEDWNESYGRKPGWRFSTVKSLQTKLHDAEHSFTGRRHGLEEMYEPLTRLGWSELKKLGRNGNRTANRISRWYTEVTLTAAGAILAAATQEDSQADNC